MYLRGMKMWALFLMLSSINVVLGHDYWDYLKYWTELSEEKRVSPATQDSWRGANSRYSWIKNRSANDVNVRLRVEGANLTSGNSPSRRSDYVIPYDLKPNAKLADNSNVYFPTFCGTTDIGLKKRSNVKQEVWFDSSDSMYYIFCLVKNFEGKGVTTNREAKEPCPSASPLVRPLLQSLPRIYPGDGDQILPQTLDECCTKAPAEFVLSEMKLICGSREQQIIDMSSHLDMKPDGKSLYWSRGEKFGLSSTIPVLDPGAMLGAEAAYRFWCENNVNKFTMSYSTYKDRITSLIDDLGGYDRRFHKDPVCIFRERHDLLCDFFKDLSSPPPVTRRTADGESLGRRSESIWAGYSNNCLEIRKKYNDHLKVAPVIRSNKLILSAQKWLVPLESTVEYQNLTERYGEELKLAYGDNAMKNFDDMFARLEARALRDPAMGISVLAWLGLDDRSVQSWLEKETADVPGSCKSSYLVRNKLYPVDHDDIYLPEWDHLGACLPNVFHNFRWDKKYIKSRNVEFDIWEKILEEMKIRSSPSRKKSFYWRIRDVLKKKKLGEWIAFNRNVSPAPLDQGVWEVIIEWFGNYSKSLREELDNFKYPTIEDSHVISCESSDSQVIPCEASDSHSISFSILFHQANLRGYEAEESSISGVDEVEVARLLNSANERRAEFVTRVCTQQQSTSNSEDNQVRIFQSPHMEDNLTHKLRLAKLDLFDDKMRHADLIYAPHLLTGSQFGSLSNFRGRDFRENHYDPLVKLHTHYEAATKFWDSGPSTFFAANYLPSPMRTIFLLWHENAEPQVRESFIHNWSSDHLSDAIYTASEVKGVLNSTQMLRSQLREHRSNLCDETKEYIVNYSILRLISFRYDIFGDLFRGTENVGAGLPACDDVKTEADVSLLSTLDYTLTKVTGSIKFEKPTGEETDQKLHIIGTVLHAPVLVAPLAKSVLIELIDKIVVYFSYKIVCNSRRLNILLDEVWTNKKDPLPRLLAPVENELTMEQKEEMINSTDSLVLTFLPKGFIAFRFNASQLKNQIKDIGSMPSNLVNQVTNLIGKFNLTGDYEFKGPLSSAPNVNTPPISLQLRLAEAFQGLLETLQAAA